MSIPSLTDLSSSTTTALALSNLILVAPNLRIGYQPYALPGPLETLNNLALPNAFLFNYEGEQTVTCESDITDHYIENNTAIQDQIALKPVTITTQGFIAELNDIAPTNQGSYNQIGQKLTTISSFVPVLTATAIILTQRAQAFYDNVLTSSISAVSAWESINNVLLPFQVQSKQQQAFNLFYGWWAGRYLFSVQTPWQVFQNMAIQSLRPIQSAETNTITTFEITFKQIRTVQSAVAQSQSSISQNRLVEQTSALVNQGVSSPPPAMSLSQGLYGLYPIPPPFLNN